MFQLKQLDEFLMDNDILKVCICGWVDLLKEGCEAVLILVEKEKGERYLPFTCENINKIFQLEK